MPLDLASNDDTTPRKACACCLQARYISSFSIELTAPDHRGAVCAICEPLSLLDKLTTAQQAARAAAIADMQAHRAGPRPASRQTKSERAFARYKAEGGKRCASCFVRKPPDTDHWHVNRGKVDGLQTTCIACCLMRLKLPRESWVVARDAMRAASSAPLANSIVDTAQSAAVSR
jgi:hypothetical protein